jgi:hypothetical protein
MQCVYVHRERQPAQHTPAPIFLPLANDMMRPPVVPVLFSLLSSLFLHSGTRLLRNTFQLCGLLDFAERAHIAHSQPLLLIDLSKTTFNYMRTARQGGIC